MNLQFSVRIRVKHFYQEYLVSPSFVRLLLLITIQNESKEQTACAPGRVHAAATGVERIQPSHCKQSFLEMTREKKGNEPEQVHMKIELPTRDRASQKKYVRLCVLRAMTRH
jgi:hypothetical protein